MAACLQTIVSKQVRVVPLSNSIEILELSGMIISGQVGRSMLNFFWVLFIICMQLHAASSLALAQLRMNCLKVYSYAHYP